MQLLIMLAIFKKLEKEDFGGFCFVSMVLVVESNVACSSNDNTYADQLMAILGSSFFPIKDFKEHCVCSIRSDTPCVAHPFCRRRSLM